MPSEIVAGLSLYAVLPGSSMDIPRPSASRAALDDSGGWPVKNSLRKRWVYPRPEVLRPCTAFLLMKGMSAAS